MPSIKIRPNESFDVGLRKFKRACEKAGIIPEVRKREFYEKPTSVPVSYTHLRAHET